MTAREVMLMKSNLSFTGPIGGSAHHCRAKQQAYKKRGSASTFTFSQPALQPFQLQYNVLKRHGKPLKSHRLRGCFYRAKQTQTKSQRTNLTVKWNRMKLSSTSALHKDEISVSVQVFFSSCYQPCVV
ncbi:uncharacterized protein LOC144095358 [Amblyomma americanum]